MRCNGINLHYKIAMLSSNVVAWDTHHRCIHSLELSSDGGKINRRHPKSRMRRSQEPLLVKTWRLYQKRASLKKRITTKMLKNKQVCITKRVYRLLETIIRSTGAVRALVSSESYVACAGCMGATLFERTCVELCSESGGFRAYNLSLSGFPQHL